MEALQTRISSLKYIYINIYTYTYTTNLQQFELKIGLFGPITPKLEVLKSSEWYQKLFLDPLSTLVKTNWMGSLSGKFGAKRRAVLIRHWKTTFLLSTTKNLRTLF